MKNTVLPLAIMLCSILLLGCDSQHRNYKKKLDVALEQVPEPVFNRYEDALFNLDTADFQEGLMKIQQDYLPFLEGDLNNPEAVQYLKDFVLDTLNRSLYCITKNQYPDLQTIKGIITAVNQHFHYYYPDTDLPETVYTCVSGVNPEMDPVMIINGHLVVSLDWYLNGHEVYDWMGMPRYLSERTSTARLAKDYAHTLYANYVEKPHKQGNLLEEMVCQGKADFFVEAMAPTMSDQVLLGYTPEQLDWAESNEGNVWADIIGSQQLYTTEFDAYRIFLSDGPFTNEYSHSAPPRLGEFLGLHIIRSYMDLNDTHLQTLMQDADLQGIFLDSGYKPKK